MAVVLKLTFAREETHLIQSHEYLTYKSFYVPVVEVGKFVIPAQVLLRVPKDSSQSCVGE